MHLIVGFLVGYVLGAKGGQEKFEELKEAWQTIINAEEFQSLLMTGRSFVNHLGQQNDAETGGDPRPVAELIRDVVGGQLSQIIAAVTELRKAA